MTPTSESSKTLSMTQLDAINIAKGLTILLLLGYALYFGISGPRQVIYLCLHITYCIWWLLEQWLFPSRRQQIFQEPTTPAILISVLLLVGVVYSLPGFLAFLNPHPISLMGVGIAIPCYILGSLINATADTQKLTAKKYDSGLVNDEIWRTAQNINYFGDLMRYLSFAIVSGSLWSYLLPALIFALYLGRIKEKQTRMQQKYSNYAEYNATTKQLIPGIW